MRFRRPCCVSLHSETKVRYISEGRHPLTMFSQIARMHQLSDGDCDDDRDDDDDICYSQ